MSWRQLLRHWLPPAVARVIDARRPSPEQRALRRFEDGGRVPWSEGYGVARNQTIAATLDDSDLTRRFADGGSLPPGFGVGLDERCVEYPWVMARLAGRRGRLLDAGSALNHAFLLDRIDLARWQMQIVTLAPEGSCFWQRGVGYLYEDLRDLPLRDAAFDAVVCVSTLEHVGFDNRLFTGRPPTPDDSEQGDHRRAMAELSRVLRPGGMLLLSIPYGRPSTFAGFRQYDRQRLDDALAAFGAARHCERVLYRYTVQGWQVATAEECADCEYVEWIARPPDERSSHFPVQPDRAAAARAVACVRLDKP